MKALVAATRPDEEIFGLRGTIARHSGQGDEVSVLIFARGSKARVPRHRHIQLRKQCALEGYALLGVRNAIFCSLKRLLSYGTPSSSKCPARFGSRGFAPNVFVAISKTLSKKLKALKKDDTAIVSNVNPHPHPSSYEGLSVISIGKDP